MYTPWGESEAKKTYAEGITFYQTPSHGGFHVLPDQNAKIHAAWRRADGWYEEDVDWAITAMTFPDLFAPEHLESARHTAKAWHPHTYMAVIGETLEPKDSFVLQRELFSREHAVDWVVVAALSSKTRPGMVDCIAIRGGHGGRGPKRRFLIPSEDYKPGQFGFVVPDDRYPYFDGSSTLWDEVCYRDPETAA